MAQSLNRLKESASQTAGPYVHIGLTPNFCEIGGVYPTDLGTQMVNDKTKESASPSSGRVLDGTGTPLKDALVEIWQADAEGLHNSPAETPRHRRSEFYRLGPQPGQHGQWRIRLRDDQARARARSTTAD